MMASSSLTTVIPAATSRPSSPNRIGHKSSPPNSRPNIRTMNSLASRIRSHRMADKSAEGPTPTPPSSPPQRMSLSIRRWKKTAEKRLNLQHVLHKAPNARSKADIEVIVASMLKLPFFQQFTSSFIEGICSTFQSIVVHSDDARLCVNLLPKLYHLMFS